MAVPMAVLMVALMAGSTAPWKGLSRALQMVERMVNMKAEKMDPQTVAWMVLQMAVWREK